MLDVERRRAKIGAEAEAYTTMGYLLGRMQSPTKEELRKGAYVLPDKVSIHRRVGVPEDFTFSVPTVLRNVADALYADQKVWGGKMMADKLVQMAQLIAEGKPVPIEDEVARRSEPFLEKARRIEKFPDGLFATAAILMINPELESNLEDAIMATMGEAGYKTPPLRGKPAVSVTASLD